MKVFTYKKYIEFIHTLRLNAVLQLAEENEKYKLDDEEQNTYEKLIKYILLDEKEVAQIINQFLEPREEIKSERLKECTSRYINRKNKDKDTIIYKLQNHNMLFVIEQQYKQNKSIPYKMLNNCIAIMQEYNKGKRKELLKNYIMPTIVPIIIYTGNIQYKLTQNKINLEYNLIDINKIAKRKLRNKNTMFMELIKIERLESKKDKIENLKKMLHNIEQIELKKAK